MDVVVDLSGSSEDQNRNWLPQKANELFHNKKKKKSNINKNFLKNKKEIISLGLKLITQKKKKKKSILRVHV